MDLLDNRLLSFMSTVHCVSMTVKRVHDVDAAASSGYGVQRHFLLLPSTT